MVLSRLAFEEKFLHGLSLYSKIHSRICQKPFKKARKIFKILIKYQISSIEISISLHFPKLFHDPKAWKGKLQPQASFSDIRPIKDPQGFCSHEHVTHDMISKNFSFSFFLLPALCRCPPIISSSSNLLHIYISFHYIHSLISTSPSLPRKKG